MMIKLRQLSLTLLIAAVLSACGSISLSNPFGADEKEQSRTPKDAIAYVCDGNKSFYVRMLNNSNDAWLIYPDHEVNLAKSPEGAGRYTSGVIALVIDGDATTLNDGEKIAYTGCKPQSAKR